MGWTQSHRLTGQVREHAWKLCAAALLGVLALPSASEEPGQAGEPWPADPAAARLLAKTLANLYAGDFVQVLELTSRNRAGRAMTRRLQVVRKESAPVRPKAPRSRMAGASGGAWARGARPAAAGPECAHAPVLARWAQRPRSISAAGAEADAPALSTNKTSSHRWYRAIRRSPTGRFRAPLET